MTEKPPDEQPSFQPFDEWLDDHGIAETSEPKPQPAPESVPAQPAPLAADIRAVLWTLPVGLAWILGGYLVPHFATHAHGAVQRLIGLALVAWVINLGCELERAYALRADYPPLGMWQWLTSRHLSRTVNQGQETVTRAANNGCALTLLAALAIPGIFTAFYVFTALLAVAIPIYITLMTATSITHIGVTLWRRQNKKGGNT